MNDHFLSPAATPAPPQDSFGGGTAPCTSGEGIKPQGPSSKETAPQDALGGAKTVQNASGKTGQAAISSICAALVHLLDQEKAEDVRVFPLPAECAIADAMIVATGGSQLHARALANKALEFLASQGIHAKHDGMQNCDWIAIDAGDVLLHFMLAETRRYYKLEECWSPAANALRRSSF